MNLETAIQNLADAINNLAKSNGIVPAGKQVKTPDAKPSDPATVAAIAGAAKSATAPASTPATEPAALEYAKDVRPVFIAYGKAKGRDAATALLGEFGVKAATEIPADKWQAFLDRIAALS